MNKETMADLVSSAIARVPDRIAVVAGDRRVSYAQWGRRAAGVAAHLLDAGLAPGDRIGFLGRNGLHASECVAVAALAGAVYVPLNYFLTLLELVPVIRLVGLKCLIYQPEFAHLIDEIMRQCPTVELALPVADGAASDSYENWAETGDSVIPAPHVDPDSPFLILFTSGSTGLPKGVTLSHGNVVASARSFVDGLEMTPNSRILMVNPHFFSAGINCGTIPGILAGATLVAGDGFQPATFLSTVARERITHCQTVPTMLVRLANHPGLCADDLATLHTLSYGSAPMPEPALQVLKGILGPRFVQTYGMTEIPELLICLDKGQDPKPVKEGFSICGRPVIPGNVQIERETGGQAAIGEIGELIVRGPSLMVGYWNKPGETAAAIRNGWMHTGDLAEQDSDGFIHIAGRKKDVINSGGIKIYPAEIERVLGRHPAVAEVTVTGVPDPEWGEKVVAFVVTAGAKRIAEAELIAFCVGQLAAYKKPKAVHFVPDLPRTHSGKIDKSMLRQTVSQQSNKE